MNGVEMTKAIKELDKDVPIIFVTAFSDAHYMQEAIELQATGYILKPIDLDMLENMVLQTIKISTLQDDFNRKSKLSKEYLKIIDENVLTSSTDLNGIITSVSQAFCKLNAYTKEELIGNSHALLRDKMIETNFYKQLWEQISQDKIWKGEIKNRKKDGSAYWVQAKIYPIYDEDGVKIGYTAIDKDITDLKRVQELSIRDGLTNIYNRRYFNELFPSFIQSAKRNNELVCFAILDIDHFKQYNDTYGHQKGDEVLIKVTQCIEQMLTRVEDMFFRLGGEEFGLLFKATHEEKAHSFLNKIVQKVYDMHIPHKTSSVCDYLSISAGLELEYANSISSENCMYKAADDLLYQAKESGRNRVIVNKLKEQDDG